MSAALSIEAWDRQFARQANWTRPTRAHLYRRADLLRARHVLDVGSGTGTVTEEIAARTTGRVIGLDLDPAMVVFARGREGRAEYRRGDAHDLPFPDGQFDVTICHFVLMWCRDAALAAREMVRVTRRGGAVLACAEPDYGGRIDYPELPLGSWQAEALRREGADPTMGRRLRSVFAQPGIAVEVGLVPGLWDLAALQAEFEAEWSVWQQSLEAVVPNDQLAAARAADKVATDKGERFVFMPVFYALVRV